MGIKTVELTINSYQLITIVGCILVWGRVNTHRPAIYIAREQFTIVWEVYHGLRGVDPDPFGFNNTTIWQTQIQIIGGSVHPAAPSQLAHGACLNLSSRHRSQHATKELVAAGKRPLDVLVSQLRTMGCRSMPTMKRDQHQPRSFTDGLKA